MQLVTKIPDRNEQLSLNRQRWREILQDPLLATLPYRVETNRFGELVMNPPPSGAHSNLQGRMTILLDRHLGDHVLPECPISTIDGVKAADVGWYSPHRFAMVKDQDVFEQAPEICVEVLSPSNTVAEMQHKRFLYFEAGACEVWICDREGKLSFYTSATEDKPSKNSKVCPTFPLSAGTR